MSVPRCKIKKKKTNPNENKKSRLELVSLTNYLNLSIIIRTLKTVYDKNDTEIFEFLQSYMALMDEVSDKRCNVYEFIDDTKKMTGIDVKKIADDAYKSVVN